MLRLSPPVQQSKIRLNSRHRYFVVGKTNTGKTVFARYLDRAWVAARWPLVIIDQDQKFVDEEKGEHYAEKPEAATVEAPWNITSTGKLEPRAPVMIFHPDLPAWSDEKFLQLMQEVFERGFIVLHFDDLFGVADGQHTPLIIRKLWTSGRKKQIPIIALVQRPVDIAKVIMNQAENFFIFLMLDPDDRERMALFLGDPKVKHPPPLYSHWELLAGETEARLVGPLPRHEVR